MSVVTIKYSLNTCSEPDPGLGRAMIKTNRQTFFLVLRGMRVSSDVCLPSSNPGLMLPWVPFLASLCLSFSIYRMELLTVVPRPQGCGED